MVTLGRYRLPALPYDYGALEPHISRPLLEWHHRQYQGGLVARIEELAAVDGGRQRRCELGRCLRNHRLHTIFWCNLDPRGGRAPLGLLHDVIRDQFRNLQRFRSALDDAAMNARSWAMLAYDRERDALAIVELDLTEPEDERLTPLMVVDAADHAYAAQYGRSKRAYIKALWHLWNWQDVAERYREARPMRRHQTGEWQREERP